MNAQRCVALTLLLAVFTLVSVADAQIAVSANDNKAVLVNGAVKVVSSPPPDTVAIIDLKAGSPRVVGEIQAPVSVVGPPVSVALTPDESLALVTAAMKVDPADPTKQAPDNRLSVIDLKASPPRVIATLETGKAPSGISINRQGTLALVSNRTDGTVSVFTIQGKTVAPAGTVEVGGPKAGGGHVAITPDGKTALVTRDADHKISVLSIEGTKVEYTRRDMTAGVRPIALDIAPSGAFAVVANIGQPTGDIDTVSLIDLKAQPPRVVDTISVGGQSPEGIKISPDGSVIAAVVQNGSNRPKESPFYNDGGKLVLLRVTGSSLSRIAEARIGHWPQGAAFSPDGKTILVGNMVEKDYWVFQWDGRTLHDTGQRVKMNGGAAAIRTAEK
ncbi:MAG: mandelate racemase [Candidatus Rokubacteria bacterium 13_1_40CM_4_69_5]|nr:MAG: mandelate racemase [Candidatus Rokubacteria bacterium 13_1_40CM_4_69_5]